MTNLSCPGDWEALAVERFADSKVSQDGFDVFEASLDGCQNVNVQFIDEKQRCMFSLQHALFFLVYVAVACAFCYTIHHFNSHSMFPPVQDLQRLTQRFDTLPESLEQCKQDLHSYRDVGPGAPEPEHLNRRESETTETDQLIKTTNFGNCWVELEKR